ncbi:MAG TPA: tetratricopeptide repeat protein [Cytophagaceae bacterium]|jgi:tetratricopeptide (TPR) repeat protein|nr:tetratricopeptide repeat protein [Cytophagaceae bacterium]
MKNKIIIGLLSIFSFACGSNKNDTSIPDPYAIENLSEASLNVLNESIDDDQSNDVLYYKRALFYYKLKNNSKALADISKAIELDDAKGEYYLLLGQVSYASGNIIAARDAAVKAESSMDKVPALMVLQANIYMDLRDSLKYTRYIDETVQMIPFKADADYVLARKALINKDSVSSIRYLQSAVHKDPDFLPAYREIIKIYLHKAMYDSSMSYVLNGIRISHQDPLFYEAEGKFFEKMKLYGAAESAYQIALKYSDKNPTYYSLLGNLKYRTGDYVKALTWYNLLLQNRPQDIELLKRCAEVATKGKDWSKAVVFYGKLMAKDSSNTNYMTQYKLAVRYANMDATEEIHEESPVIMSATRQEGEIKSKTDTSGSQRLRSLGKPKTDSTTNE